MVGCGSPAGVRVLPVAEEGAGVAAAQLRGAGAPGPPAGYQPPPNSRVFAAPHLDVYRARYLEGRSPPPMRGLFCTCILVWGPSLVLPDQKDENRRDTDRTHWGLAEANCEHVHKGFWHRIHASVTVPNNQKQGQTLGKVAVIPLRKYSPAEAGLVPVQALPGSPTLVKISRDLHVAFMLPDPEPPRILQLPDSELPCASVLELDVGLHHAPSGTVSGESGWDAEEAETRLFTWAASRAQGEVFSIVVFGSIVNEGYLNSPTEGEEFCIYNRNPSACSYGVAVGVLAFLTCLLYLALDVYFPQISSVKDRKKAVLSDIGVSAFWAFLWFVGFCYLANQWQVSKPKDNPLNEGTDAARAAIAFSFFSIFTWAGQAVLAFQRYQIGADSALFSQDYMDPSQDSSMPYAPYAEPSTGPDPAGTGGTYQQPANAFDSEPQGYQSQGY
ncbi:PREDICTED: synaptogyrin-1 [Dipodomys ordii]|uniref:Synaptogyrin-1 n=1 Tax=Dipodomys ordii TaxID=10020 RepID=A0A1S3FWN2_DIPOR|nr:PREDICTED: synaptogyrin-1 [Dipodomys ordii]